MDPKMQVKSFIRRHILANIMCFRFVFGSINGKLEEAFSKLAKLHSKNNFAFAVVAGNLFAEDDEQVERLLNGEITIPVSTYFTVATTALPERIQAKILKNEDICENLHFLGKRSITKTSDGIRIVTLGGALDPEIVGGQSKEQHLPWHTLDDAKSLKGANSTDILLTSVWPNQVWNGSKVALPVETSTIPNSDTVAELVTALKPRYHLSMSAGDFFYEREAFFHPPKAEGEPSMEVTRFISLPAFGNAAKAKAMYAFSLPTQAATSLPQVCTISPFTQAGSKKRHQPDDGTYSRFGSHGDDGHRRHKRRKDRSPPPGPDRCFFCLSNPNLPTHMVCSIGEEAYTATAKGPLPLPSTFTKEGLSFPGHMVIVPLTHAPNISTSDMADSATSTFQEMTRFRESLQNMVASKSQQTLGGVSWEISRSRNIHAHWQFMPVLATSVKKGLVEAAFRVEAENMKLPKFEVKEFGTADEIEGDYFRLWIWAQAEAPQTNGNDDSQSTGETISKSLVMRFGENVRFDLQFGRKVMAKLMGLEKRLYWQDCIQTEEEETADVTEFRKAYDKEFNFTLE